MLREVESRGRERATPRLPAAAGPESIAPASDAAPAERVRLSVVIPTYNERANLPELVRRLRAALHGSSAGLYELIVVDDDSPDRTWELAQGLAAKVPVLRTIRRVGEKGLSTAVIRGWQAARGDVLGVIDGDLQHPPEVLASLWRAIEGGADLAVGSRHAEGGGLGSWSVLRRALSSGARLLAVLLLPSAARRLSDPMSGCFMVRRSAVAGRPLRPLGYKILLEVLVRGAVRRVQEVGYAFETRRRGESKVTPRVYVEYLVHLLRLRFCGQGITRFLRFAAVGVGGVLVDTGVLFALSDPRALGLDLTIGKVVAAEVAMVQNFFWNDAFTFGDLAARAPGIANKVRRLLRFNLVCVAGLGLQVVLLHAQIALLGVDRYAANAVSICLVAVWNYWLGSKLAWASDRGAGSVPTGTLECEV